MTNLVTCHLGRAINRLSKIDDFNSFLARVGERLEILYQGGHAMRPLNGFGKYVLAFPALCVIGLSRSLFCLQQLEVADHVGQGVVDFMGHPRGQASHGRGPLRSNHALLHFTALVHFVRQLIVDSLEKRPGVVLLTRQGPQDHPDGDNGGQSIEEALLRTRFFRHVVWDFKAVIGREKEEEGQQKDDRAIGPTEPCVAQQGAEHRNHIEPAEIRIPDASRAVVAVDQNEKQSCRDDRPTLQAFVVTARPGDGYSRQASPRCHGHGEPGNPNRVVAVDENWRHADEYDRDSRQDTDALALFGEQ